MIALSPALSWLVIVGCLVFSLVTSGSLSRWLTPRDR